MNIFRQGTSFIKLSNTLVALCLSLTVQAQRHCVYSDRIGTLQVIANDEWQKPPIIELGTNDSIHISFDDLTHNYHRYTYSITHCNADWSESTELFSSDYIAGFQSGETIDDYEESINTNQLYNHYRLSIPNDKCRIKMSGNYRVDVIDDESDDTMFTARFYVVEPLVNVSINVLDNTDIDNRKSHQQVDLRVDYPTTLSVTDPRRQFTVKVMQNDRVDNMVVCPPAPQILHGSMIWTHCRDLIFNAGNEYHKFEFLDPHRNSLGVEHVSWDGEMYNIDIYHDYERRAYVYDEDANGAFLVRNSDNVDNDVTTDYMITHFYLDTPPLNGNVYIEGKWTLNTISDRYKMNYDESLKCYTISLPLKMGYYSYEYLFVPNGEESTIVCPTEGNFFQTKNNYTVLTYFRGDIDRTDRLVGASY